MTNKQVREDGGAVGATAQSGTEQRSVETATPESLSGDELLLGGESDTEPVLSVVIPTLNEEEGIEECIQRVKNALEEMQVFGEVIVSDDSTDRTPDIARRLGAIVVTPDRDGYGYAYRYAFEHVRGEYIVIGDADTTYDFEQIPRLLTELNETGADMVMGSRLEGEIKHGAMPALHQYVGNPLLTKFLNTFYGAGVSDAHSGFRIFTRETLDTLDLQTTGMEFASEMIMEAGAKDLQIAEVPITYHVREGEATLDSFRDGWRHVKFMLQNAPGYLFTGPALGLGVVGMVLFALSFLEMQIRGVYLGTHAAIAGSLALIVGYQVGNLSVFSTMATDPIRHPRDPLTSVIKERFRLQHGATIGVGLFALGAVAIGYFAWQWLTSGLEQSPSVTASVIAVTAIILGIQTVFHSFFLSMLAESRKP